LQQADVELFHLKEGAHHAGRFLHVNQTLFGIDNQANTLIGDVDRITDQAQVGKDTLSGGNLSGSDCGKAGFGIVDEFSECGGIMIPRICGIVTISSMRV
jgi:hypothetical protein